MLKGLCRLDDNLLSFLCGIFSNIPISLCFAFTVLGNSCLSYINFALTLASMCISVALVVFAFQFTLRKMKYIQPILNQKDGETEKEVALNNYLSEGLITFKKHKRLETVKASKYMKKPLVGFFVCGCLLIIVVIALWILYNFV